MIHSAFLYLLTVVSLEIGIDIGAFFALFSKSKTAPLQTAARIWARFALAFSGIKVSVSGLENIPRERGLIFASNHQSFVDTVLTLTSIPTNFRVLAAKKYFRVPILGRGWRKAGYILVDQDSPSSFFHILKKTIEIIKAGESVLIFPEGTRSKNGKLGEFKHASLLPALRSGAPIIPIAISGSFDILPRGTWIIYPRPVKFSFGKPIYIRSEAEYDKKLAEIREAIARML
ncbi:MAG: lysophospholipid acyltransferase family protein [Candidatus Margulisiibacteriota bacterium]